MYFASEYVLASKAVKNTLVNNVILKEELDEPDTNIVSVKFNQLVETSLAHAGDPVKCDNCEAILSKISVVGNTLALDGKRIWICEFCNFENKIFIEDNEIPREDEVTYIIEPAVDKKEEITDSKYLIYCIDISGDYYKKASFLMTTLKILFQ